jgi:hypothetical protein
MVLSGTVLSGTVLSGTVLSWMVLSGTVLLNKIYLFFTVAPCILISSTFFTHQQMHILLFLENSKIYIKTYTKIAPTCFGLRPSSGSLHWSLAKVTLILKQSVKLRRYVLCGGVALCYVQVWLVCAVCCVLCRMRRTQSHHRIIITT